MDRNGFSKSQRMQLKAFICVLGALLLIILVVGKLIVTLMHKEEEEPELPKPHIPVIQKLSNVWILEEDDSGILIFRDGERERYLWGELSGEMDEKRDATASQEKMRYRPEKSVREQVADIILKDGEVTNIVLKKNKVNGKVLRADEEGIEIEGYGKIPLAENYKGYRLYDSLEMCTASDICFGYSFTDFCLEDGKICGILMVKEEAMQYIRVLIKADDLSGIFHENTVITSDTDFTVVYGEYDNLKTEKHSAGEKLEFEMGSNYFESDRVYIVPDVLTGKTCIAGLRRSQGAPSYRGKLELLLTESGIIIVNEVLLEEYLYSVVPSEMPAGYPMEALKAQAVCARTYAYGHMEHAGYPQYGAHVDDSTSYQVYNNILEQESTTTSVKETYGQLLFTETGELAGTYYYSTSCGIGSDANVWKTEEAKQITYLHAKEISRTAMKQENSAKGEELREEEAFAEFISNKNKDDFEASEGWYRWTYEVEELDVGHIREILQKRYAANNKLILTLQDGEYVSREIGKFHHVREIRIEKRGAGGVADELIIETEEDTYKVISEHNIRYVLNNGESKICRQDGSKVASNYLLPSGFFVISTGKEEQDVVGYTISGGGFGHGVGMSQNGARHMAESGYSAEEILIYFYESCKLVSIYE